MLFLSFPLSHSHLLVSSFPRDGHTFRFRNVLLLFLSLFLMTETNDAKAQWGASPVSSSREGVVIDGTLTVHIEDEETRSRTHYYLETTDRRLTLHFARKPPRELRTGMRVRVRGVQTNNTLALDSNSSSVQVLATAPLASTFGARKVLVILVNFQDNTTEPYTVADARNVVFGETSDFLYENSYQQTWLIGDVAGWYTIPVTSTVCDIFAIADDAKAAASAAGFNLAAYTHYVYAFPQNACGGLGVGTLGGNPSQAWLIGNLDLKVLSHELGHNFGLYHSHALDCGTSVVGTNCSVFEYGDRIDTMGNIAAGHFNAFQKERLGWLDYGVSPAIATVNTNGLYTIEPLEASGPGPKGLAILKSTDPTTGQQTWYYVEYRQALGFDSFLATNSNILNGVVVHTGSLSNGDSSNLLDMTPASGSQNWSDWSDPALGVGQSFSDPNSGVTIGLVSVSSAGATVSVNFASPDCEHTNPSVTISPAQSQAVLTGTAVTYTVAVTNNDPSSCPTSSFALQATPPSGWEATFASSTLTLNPGVSTSTTLTVKSPTVASSGTYSIDVSASNSKAATSTASTAATYVIGASTLRVNAATDKTVYEWKQTATIFAVVTADGFPVANASVSFVITKPNGATTITTTTTEANGAAAFKFRFRRQDPAGQYQVHAEAKAEPALTGDAWTSFMFQ
ncbi:MAG: NEW3 domain-containing protein [Candidatus Binatia bacterium]